MGKVDYSIIGKKYNLLTVVSFKELRGKKNNAYFLCRCDCGNEKIMSGSQVKNGAVKSCGCFKGEFKEKKCEVCGELFKPTGRCAKYCSDCGVEQKRVNQLNGVNAYRYRQAIKNGTLDRLGIGRGGGQLTGKDSPYYKNGIGYFNQVSPEIKSERQYCERCGKDLNNAKQGQWCVHHKDHDRDNNTDENFELLCKRCHQIEHECWNNLPQNLNKTLAKQQKP